MVSIDANSIIDGLLNEVDEYADNCGYTARSGEYIVVNVAKVTVFFNITWNDGEVTSDSADIYNEDNLPAEQFIDTVPEEIESLLSEVSAQYSDEYDDFVSCSFDFASVSGNMDYEVEEYEPDYDLERDQRLYL